MCWLEGVVSKGEQTGDPEIVCYPSNHLHTVKIPCLNGRGVLRMELEVGGCSQQISSGLIGKPSPLAITYSLCLCSDCTFIKQLFDSYVVCLHGKNVLTIWISHFLSPLTAIYHKTSIERLPLNIWCMRSILRPKYWFYSHVDFRALWQL